jgi:hypothetical protein
MAGEVGLGDGFSHGGRSGKNQSDGGDRKPSSDAT